MKRWGVLAVAILCASCSSGGGSAAPTTFSRPTTTIATIDLHGYAKWFPLDASNAPADCRITDGTGQLIAEGLGVVLRDGAGKQLATSSLAAPQYDGGVCFWRFAFPKVPVEKYYTVHVGPSDTEGLAVTGGDIHADIVYELPQ